MWTSEENKNTKLLVLCKLKTKSKMTESGEIFSLHWPRALENCCKPPHTLCDAGSKALNVARAEIVFRRQCKMRKFSDRLEITDWISAEH